MFIVNSLHMMEFGCNLYFMPTYIFKLAAF